MGIDFPSDYPYPSKTGGPGQQHAHNRSIKDNLSHTPIDGCNSTNRQPDHRAALHHSLNFVFPIQHLPIKGFRFQQCRRDEIPLTAPHLIKS